MWWCSSFPRLHVGRDGTSSSQAFEAFVGVVYEDPVLVLQISFSLIGHLSGWSNTTSSKAF